LLRQIIQGKFDYDYAILKKVFFKLDRYLWKEKVLEEVGKEFKRKGVVYLGHNYGERAVAIVFV